MSRTRSRPSLVLAVVALALGPIGCGGPTKTDVTGTVMYNGRPLDKPGGGILFVGPDGTQVSATINPDGTYRATGVAVGPNKVAVSYVNPKFQDAVKAKGHLPSPDGKTKPTPPGADLSPHLTPAEYASPDTSNLVVTIEKDVSYNPALTGPPIK